MKSTILCALKTGTASVVLGAALLAGPAFAQGNGAQGAGAASGNATQANGQQGNAGTANEIIVTGSAIKRLNYETPSPVDVINTKQLQNTGYNSIAAVLTDLTANGAGTLSANNSEAFAGGAAGIALRGLTVGDTLTLVDGHRLAPYPLSDDGERQFTDINSIPFNAVERVEVLKDGASSLYGSDAIAGVVNIIMKKQIVGLDGLAEVGTAQHGGGTTHHFGLSYGMGDLHLDGYNAFLTVEYRDQDPILLSQRGYEPWGNLDYRGIGGNDLRPGAPNFANGNVPATMTPYLVNPDGSYTFLGSGCNTAALNDHQCTYKSPQVLQQPMRDISVMAGLTKDFASGWEAKLRLSFFDSQDHQESYNYGGSLGMGYSEYPGPSYNGNDSNPIGGVPTPNIGLISNYTLPANYLGSGSQAGAYLEGVIPGFGLPTINIDSKTYRIALDVTGKLAGWDVTGSLGFSDVVTQENYVNFINYDTLYTDLTTFNSNGLPVFNPLGGNSQSVMNAIAPSFNNTATDRLFYAEGDATRRVATLPGGDLSLAMGATVISKYLHNPGAPSILSGEIGGTFSTYAIGEQTDVAEYIEADANLFNSLNINASARDDWYDTYGNSLTPKVGIKWKPISSLALRGTFAKGFRAPDPAEFGQSATVFGLGGLQDAVLCPNGSNGPWKVGEVPAACSANAGFVQTTTSTLKPETSTSFTGGAVWQPLRNWSTTIDYYHIKINNQIVSESELPSYNLLASCERGANTATTGVVTGVDANGNITSEGTAVPLAGPLAACFAGYVNAQSTVTSGLDLQSTYKLHLGKSTVTATAEWTHLFEYNMTSPSGVTYNLAGTHGPSGISGDTGNPRDHINASLTYEGGPLSATVSGYWISSYSVLDPSASGGSQSTCAGAWNAALALATVTPSSVNSQYCRVKSFASVNFVTSYKFTPRVTMTLTIDNLFDASAPLDPETYGGSFTPYNPAIAEDGVIGRYFMLGIRYTM